MSWTNDYIGLPFKSKGRDRDGLDCWGLFRLVHKEQLNILHPSYEETYEEANANPMVGSAFTKGLESGWRRVLDAKPFDVVILSIAGKPFHCGVVVENGRMLHIMRGSDAIVEPYTNRYWGRRVEGIYRYEQ